MLRWYDMAKRKREVQVEAKIRSEEDFRVNEVDEQGLFYVVLENDAIIEEGNITFLENDALRIYNRILGELIEDYGSAPNLAFKNKMAKKIAGLTVMPLRLH
jgi:hypothetical protein